MVAVGPVVGEEQVHIAVLVEVAGPGRRGGMGEHPLAVRRGEFSVVIPVDVAVDVALPLIEIGGDEDVQPAVVVEIPDRE